jgi:hypothetical protein
MALYSSYIIVNETFELKNIYSIEAIAEYKKYRYDLNLRENIKCVLKYLIDGNNFEIIELHPIDFSNITDYGNVMLAMKYHFDFKLEFFKKYRDNQANFDLEKVMIAIIYKNDFDKKINEANFIAKMKPEI